MEKIAVLLTCYNRKEGTINCISNLYQAVLLSEHILNINVYLTDDGSDGTGDAVKGLFPDVTVLKGNGNLFWAGGMRNSWREAQKYNYDAYLLLNDDTNVMNNVFDELFRVHEYCVSEYGKAGIYIGATCDRITKKITYGGTVFINRFLNKYKILVPDGQIRDCDLGNGNIMFVAGEVFNSIGMLSDKYTHAIADYDYTLTAKKNNIPVLVTAEFCGECSQDHVNKYERFKMMTIGERIKFSNSPVGFAFPEMVSYMRKNFPYRAPVFWLTGWFKILFPRIYISISKLR